MPACCQCREEEKCKKNFRCRHSNTALQGLYVAIQLLSRLYPPAPKRHSFLWYTFCIIVSSSPHTGRPHAGALTFKVSTIRALTGLHVYETRFLKWNIMRQLDRGNLVMILCIQSRNCSISKLQDNFQIIFLTGRQPVWPCVISNTRFANGSSTYFMRTADDTIYHDQNFCAFLTFQNAYS